MKVIELLNKIANREEVPTTIKYQDNYYNFIRKYNEDWEEYELGYKNLNGGYLNIWRDNVLNDEVEIIEEPQEHKIPEKIGYILHGDFSEVPSNEMLMNKINEILDYLEEIE